MAGYIGSKAAVTQVDGYTKSEADNRYVEGDDTLYVDQANNRVGIGISPSKKLDVDTTMRVTNAAGTSAAELDISSGSTWRLRSNPTSGTNSYGLDFIKGSAGTDVKMSIDSSGRVGIGTAPSYLFHVNGSGDAVAAVTAGATSIAALNLGNSTNLADGGIRYDNSADALQFRAANAERMRIDGSGRLLHGKSSTSFSTAGHRLDADGNVEHIRSGAAPLHLNRKSTFGDIAVFYKDGSTMGSIGADSGSLYIGGGDVGFGFYQVSDALVPINGSTGALRDNAIDLGISSGRYDDIYATNGSIQTSDRNEKQDIEELTEAEQRVAVAAKGLLRKFRWKSAVAEKGEAARTHFGIIAQDLQAAFAAEGLDAGDYAMFISDTWWEHQVEVPAVEAVAEVLDDDGNVVTEAVEAVDAYTRTDTYDTQEEAPVGATQKTRLGVRYSELLAFIIGAL